MTTTKESLESLKKSYDSITQSFSIPPSDDPYTAKNVVIRQMVVDLDEVYWNLEQKNKDWETVKIYADVVEIPPSEDASFVIRGTFLQIFARRIEVIGDSNAIIMTYKELANPLIIYTNEVFGELTFAQSIITNRKNDIIDLQVPEKSLGMKVIGGDNISLSKLESIAPEMLVIESDLYWLSVSSFFVATNLYETQPNLAKGIVAWLKKVTFNWVEMQEMFLQSSALLYTLEKSLENTPFVPYVSPQVNEDLSKSFTEVVKSFEQEYDRFRDANRSIEDRKESAQLMLGYYDDTSKFSQNLIEQCQTNLENAQEGLKLNQKHLVSQQDKIKVAKQNFEEGLEAWKKEQEREAAMAIAGAILGVVAGVGSMFFGNPAGVATATASIQGATGAIEVTVKLVETASKLAKIMEKIAKAIEIIEKVYDTIQKILEATKKLDTASSQDNLLSQINQATASSSNSEESFDDTDWSVLQEEFDAFLSYPIDQSIGGAVDYKKELRILVIYGKALNSSKLQVTQLTQQLVRLQLEKQVSDNQVNRIIDYVGTLIERQKPNEQMMQLFYQRYLNVKRWLFVALENYNAGYRYWALRQPSFSPSILDRASVIEKDLTTVKRDYKNALENFNPAPSTFDNKFCYIKEQDVLETFKITKELVWTISSEEPIFSSLDRVRLDIVRVWLDGAKHKDPNGTIYVSMCTDGLYYDRLGSNQYQFVGEPVKRYFEYSPDNQKTTDEKIQLDGDVAKQFEDAYFKPTPFTTWIISLPDNIKNEGIDLTNVTQIRMEFAGSAVGS